MHRVCEALVRVARSRACCVVNPPPPEHALGRGEVDGAVKQALADAARSGIGGPAPTPHLLESPARATGGPSPPGNLSPPESHPAGAARVTRANPREHLFLCR